MDLIEQARQILLKKGTSTDAPVVYILRLASGLLYVGSTTNLLQRMADHTAGIACKTTRDVKPENLLFAEAHPTFPSARKREAQIKRWSHAKKEALVLEDYGALRRLSKSHD